VESRPPDLLSAFFEKEFDMSTKTERKMTHVSA
jgi:hypothetical protein